MKVLLPLVMLVLCAVFYRIGTVNERLAIKATCESADQPTIIDGVSYVCLSPAQAAQLRQALAQRGA